MIAVVAVSVVVLVVVAVRRSDRSFVHSLPIGIHDWEDVDIVEVDNVVVFLVALDKLPEDVGHRGGADPFTGMNAFRGEERKKLAWG